MGGWGGSKAPKSRVLSAWCHASIRRRSSQATSVEIAALSTDNRPTCGSIVQHERHLSRWPHRPTSKKALTTHLLRLSTYAKGQTPTSRACSKRVTKVAALLRNLTQSRTRNETSTMKTHYQHSTDQPDYKQLVSIPHLLIINNDHNYFILKESRIRMFNQHIHLQTSKKLSRETRERRQRRSSPAMEFLKWHPNTTRTLNNPIRWKKKSRELRPCLHFRTTNVNDSNNTVDYNKIDNIAHCTPTHRGKGKRNKKEVSFSRANYCVTTGRHQRQNGFQKLQPGVLFAKRAPVLKALKWGLRL